MAAETTDHSVVARLIGDADITDETRVFVSGWRKVAGVMLLSPCKDGSADLQVTLAAENERALRDLLLAFPGGKTGIFHYADDWMLDAVSEIIDGRGGPGCYVGRKRGSREKAVAGTVAGKKDPVLAEFRESASLKGGLEHSRFVAEGVLLAERAVDDGLPVLQVLYTPAFEKERGGTELLSRAHDAGISCHRVSDGLMGSVTTTRPVPSVAASVYTEYRDASRMHVTPETMLLIADSVSNPNNLGMVLRTADALGVEGIVIIGDGASPFHKECVRAARGAVGRVPIYRCAEPEEYLKNLRSKEFRILGATSHASRELDQVGINRPVAVVVGSESEGIRPPILDLCTETVRIPMAPGQSSLNVGVATGILLYEFIRR